MQKRYVLLEGSGSCRWFFFSEEASCRRRAAFHAGLRDFPLMGERGEIDRERRFFLPEIQVFATGGKIRGGPLESFGSFGGFHYKEKESLFFFY